MCAQNSCIRCANAVVGVVSVVHVAFSSRYLFIIHVNIGMSVIFIIAIIISISNCFGFAHFISIRVNGRPYIGEFVCMHESTILNIPRKVNSKTRANKRANDRSKLRVKKMKWNGKKSCEQHAVSNEQWGKHAWNIKPVILYNYIAIKWSSIHHFHSSRNWRECRSVMMCISHEHYHKYHSSPTSNGMPIESVLFKNRNVYKKALEDWRIDLHTA